MTKESQLVAASPGEPAADEVVGYSEAGTTFISNSVCGCVIVCQIQRILRFGETAV